MEIFCTLAWNEKYKICSERPKFFPSSSPWQFTNPVARGSDHGEKHIRFCWGVCGAAGACRCPASHSPCTAAWLCIDICAQCPTLLVLSFSMSFAVGRRYRVLDSRLCTQASNQADVCVLFSSLPRLQLHFQVAISVFPEMGLHRATRPWAGLGPEGFTLQLPSPAGLSSYCDYFSVIFWQIRADLVFSLFSPIWKQRLSWVFYHFLEKIDESVFTLSLGNLCHDIWKPPKIKGTFCMELLSWCDVGVCRLLMHVHWL